MIKCVTTNPNLYLKVYKKPAFFGAGVIHGWLNGDFAKGLSYGTITAACVMSQNGDMLVINRDNLNTLHNNRIKFATHNKNGVYYGDNPSTDATRR